jgi:Phospholipase_D-nuclease N-terminal
MNGTMLVRRLAERRIRRACRRLPEAMREECFLEWTAELPAILGDPDGGRGFLRQARALRYSAGISRATRRLRRASGASHPAARPVPTWRTGAPPPVPRGPGFRATAGVGIWLVFLVVIVTLVREFQPHSFLALLPGLLAAAGFVAVCLIDLVRASEVRYLPKWAWALACILWIPLGGIMYFSVGRASRPRRRPDVN